MKLFYTVVLISLTIAYSCSSAQKQGKSAPAKAKAETKVILPAQQVATPSGINYVYDYGNIFSPDEEKKLDSLARIFEKSNLIPIRIETVSDTTITVADLDQYNKKLLKEWSAMHGNSDRCMSISISKRFQSVRVDYGPFVSRFLSSGAVETILENQFSPLFKQEQFYTGTWSGLNELMDTIRRNIKF